MRSPVLHMDQFSSSQYTSHLYVNQFSRHLVKNKDLVFQPHSHDFYLCVLFTKGDGEHEIDFKTLPIKPGRVFFLKPGQTHSWKFTEDPEGYIFFHSKEFFEMTFTNNALNAFPFYQSYQNPPFLDAEDKTLELQNKFHELWVEYDRSQLFRELKIATLMNDIYIDLARKYRTHIDVSKSLPIRYLQLLEEFEQLLQISFGAEKLPKYYASKLNITTKHLNRVLKETVNKTTHEMISERVLIEAKKRIVQTKEGLLPLSEELGFADYSYFSRYFKLKTGWTPLEFKKKYAK